MRKSLQPEFLFPARQWGFSQATVSPAGTIIHIAGQVAWDSAGVCVIHDLEGQFRQVLRQVIMVVEEAGGQADDLQMLRIYITNFHPSEHTDLIARVLIDFFGTESPPASTWLGVQTLAQPEYLVEVDAVAVCQSLSPAHVQFNTSSSDNG